VQRLFKLEQIPSEKEIGMLKVNEWPSKGQVEFKDVSLKYRPNTEAVL